MTNITWSMATRPFAKAANIFSLEPVIARTESVRVCRHFSALHGEKKEQRARVNVALGRVNARKIAFCKHVCQPLEGEG